MLARFSRGHSALALVESTTVAQDRLMAELKRVGTQQEALRKAVAEAISDAHANGKSFSVSPLKGFIEPGRQDKAAQQDAAPATPGIQAKWTNSPSTSRQGSGAAALNQPDNAAVQAAKADPMDSRAESLPEPYQRDQFASSTLHTPQHDLPPVPAKHKALPPEALVEAGVNDSRSALARMQVALGGHDDSGAAAFRPGQYTFDKLPSQAGVLSILEHIVSHMLADRTKNFTFSSTVCLSLDMLQTVAAHDLS